MLHIGPLKRPLEINWGDRFVKWIVCPLRILHEWSDVPSDGEVDGIDYPDIPPGYWTSYASFSRYSPHPRVINGTYYDFVQLFNDEGSFTTSGPVEDFDVSISAPAMPDEAAYPYMERMFEIDPYNADWVAGSGAVPDLPPALSGYEIGTPQLYATTKPIGALDRYYPGSGGRNRYVEAGLKGAAESVHEVDLSATLTFEGTGFSLVGIQTDRHFNSGDPYLECLVLFERMGSA
jgi:hypothetical protein